MWMFVNKALLIQGWTKVFADSAFRLPHSADFALQTRVLLWKTCRRSLFVEIVFLELRKANFISVLARVTRRGRCLFSVRLPSLWRSTTSSISTSRWTESMIEEILSVSVSRVFEPWHRLSSGTSWTNRFFSLSALFHGFQFVTAGLILFPSSAHFHCPNVCFRFGQRIVISRHRWDVAREQKFHL